LIHRLKDAGIPVISEIEFAGKHTNATIVAITGSNGKTTTTNLTYHLLQSAGLDAALGGNVGYSFARLLTEELHQYYVLELSSFQLDGIKAFRPDISMLLNISPDHLDRYEYKMENYVASKFRVMMNQRAEDHFIFNAKDENILSFLKNEKLKVNLIEVDDVKTTNEKLIVNQFDFDLSQTSLKGRHNLFNATCAIKAAILLGVEKKAIQLGLNSFVNAPHRLESVCTTNNVEYINDSKATNVDAVYFALDAMTKPIVWIVGGTDKGNDYGPILDLVESKVKAIVCLGLDNTKILEVFTPIVKNIEETKSANEAVAIASTYAESGDVVLLSPACASFDLFKNYEDRGDQFKSAVLGLKIKD
ncbi:MAG: UDP-N-acetylmuramoylalanine--D-glutamate ligase, partial [Saprospiraceae bacterium]